MKGGNVQSVTKQGRMAESNYPSGNYQFVAHKGFISTGSSIGHFFIRLGGPFTGTLLDTKGESMWLIGVERMRCPESSFNLAQGPEGGKDD